MLLAHARYHVVREVSILKGINHPHIVRLIDVIHEFDSVSLIYECLPRDLRSILDENSPEYEPGPAVEHLQLKDYYRWGWLLFWDPAHA
jgi:serine/threonine protein kinase